MWLWWGIVWADGPYEAFEGPAAAPGSWEYITQDGDTDGDCGNVDYGDFGDFEIRAGL